MTLKTLLAAAAATALLSGAAHAQDSMNQSQPADPKNSQTGVPSVDSSRPTGADAGKTNMPNGTVSGEATSATSSATDASATEPAPPAPDTTASSPATDTAMPPASTDVTAPTTGATASTGMATDTSASLTTTTATNGPVADTPENRAKYRPLSRAGRATAAKGN